ncbi:YkgJ family cysteine cluster protein [Dyella sp. 20L07]|uniref:YkgJ family cysteine cluster protein n=1 Tax=Dyella sp. 20L07 TaxID=3384240 RepID=UPI003D2A660F
MSISPDPYAESVDPSVSCSQCEAVCCRLTVLLMPDDHVPEWLIERNAHGMETLAKGDDGWCAAVDPNTLRCTIYEQRPTICRKFTMGSPGCRDERDRWYSRKPIPTPAVLINY